MVRENRCRGAHRAPVLSIPGQPVKPTRRARRPGAPSPVPRNAPPAGADVPIGPSSSNAVSVDRRAHNTRKGHAASVRRQSRQRLRCVRPYKRYTEAFRLTRDGAPRSSRPTEICVATPPPPTGTAAFTAQRTTIQPSSFGGKSSEAGRAAAAAHSKSKDGGTLSRRLLLSKNHRRRVRSANPTEPARPARKPRPWGS